MNGRAATWTFEVVEAFVLSGRGPAVSGHILSGTIRPGDGFASDDGAGGTVLAVAGIRTEGDHGMVGLIIDHVVTAGTTLHQVPPPEPIRRS